MVEGLTVGKKIYLIFIVGKKDEEVFHRHQHQMAQKRWILRHENPGLSDLARICHRKLATSLRPWPNRFFERNLTPPLRFSVKSAGYRAVKKLGLAIALSL